MSNKIKNFDILKKIGFDKDAEWLLHDDNFFSKFIEIITDENVLTTEEILEWEQIKEEGSYLTGDDLNNKLFEIEQKYPGLLDCTTEDVEIAKAENEYLEHRKNELIELEKKSQKTLSQVDREITNLELQFADLKNQENATYSKCIDEAEKLQNLKQQNKTLYDKMGECYMKTYSPPLFLFQMPFDQYYAKHDLFLHNLNQFIHENFNLVDNIDEHQSEDQDKNRKRLEKCKKNLMKFEIKLVEEQISNNMGVEELFDKADYNIINLPKSEIIKRTKTLEESNKNYESDSLVNQLQELINQSIQQKIELILYHNTKEKYERAIKRLNKLKNISDIVSDTLTNADAIWIIMQLDLENIKKYLTVYNIEQLVQENQKCIKRTEKLIQLQQNDLLSLSFDYSMRKISEIILKYLKEIKLNQHLKFNNTSLTSFTWNQFLHENEKILKLIQFRLNSIISKKHYSQHYDFFNELENKYKFLTKLLFDGPTSIPLLESSELLEQIVYAQKEEMKLNEQIRKLRFLYEENIQNKKNDKLWKYNQVLWIWFLTDPKKMILAIEDVRKIASKIPAVTGNTLCGIQRMN